MKTFGLLAVICLQVTAKPRHVVGSQQYHDSWVEKVDADSTYKAYQDVKTSRTIEHGRRPVIGILSEPIRGDLVDGEFDSDLISYVPKTHVQFLEQAGIRVVPIDYHMPKKEQRALLDKLNGVYVPGDSHLTSKDEEYKSAFMQVLDYTTEQAKINKEHFPVFFMGNTLTTLVQATQEMKGRLRPMKGMVNEMYTVSLLQQPDDSYLFHGMPRKEFQAVFNVAKFLNTQATGLTLQTLDDDSKMRRLIKPLATFDDGEEDEFIAIAEGIDIPIYIFTYQVEMVQFYFEDPSATLDEFLLDHSLIARKHAQTVASLIADESRLSTHNFDDPEEVFEALIRHKREVRIRYENDDDERHHLPKGMTEHEVYLL